MAAGQASTSSSRHRIDLDESEMPTRWYNVLHDLPTPPPPPLHPARTSPSGPRTWRRSSPWT